MQQPSETVLPDPDGPQSGHAPEDQPLHRLRQGPPARQRLRLRPRGGLVRLRGRQAPRAHPPLPRLGRARRGAAGDLLPGASARKSDLSLRGRRHTGLDSPPHAELRRQGALRRASQEALPRALQRRARPRARGLHRRPAPLRLRRVAQVRARRDERRARRRQELEQRRRRRARRRAVGAPRRHPRLVATSRLQERRAPRRSDDARRCAWPCSSP